MVRMRLQDHMIDVIRGAQQEVFRYAKAVPQDKLEWRPLDAGRSVLDMARELAKTPDWARYVLTDAKPAEGTDPAAAQKAEMESWKTVEDCERACLEKLEELFEVYRSMPDEQLSQTKWLPFNGGRDHSYAELLDYPRWNFTYHLGQIAYIQTLYGDGEMY